MPGPQATGTHWNIGGSSEHQETCFYSKGGQAPAQLPREAKESSSSEIIKIHLDMDLNNQLWGALLELRVGPSGPQRSFPNSTLL